MSEAVYPNQELTVDNLSGTLTDLADESAGWYEALDSASSTQLVVGFPDPGSLDEEAIQTIRVWVRRTNNSNRAPTTTVAILVNGEEVASSTEDVASTSGQAVEASWSGSDESSVVVDVSTPNTGGGPNDRNTAEVGGVEWQAVLGVPDGSFASGDWASVVFAGGPLATGPAPDIAETYRYRVNTEEIEDLPSEWVEVEGQEDGDGFFGGQGSVAVDVQPGGGLSAGVVLSSGNEILVPSGDGSLVQGAALSSGNEILVPSGDGSLVQGAALSSGAPAVVLTAGDGSFVQGAALSSGAPAVVLTAGESEILAAVSLSAGSNTGVLQGSGSLAPSVAVLQGNDVVRVVGEGTLSTSVALSAGSSSVAVVTSGSLQLTDLDSVFLSGGPTIVVHGSSSLTASKFVSEHGQLTALSSGLVAPSTSLAAFGDIEVGTVDGSLRSSLTLFSGDDIGLSISGQGSHSPHVGLSSFGDGALVGAEGAHQSEVGLVSGAVAVLVSSSGSVTHFDSGLVRLVRIKLIGPEMQLSVHDVEGLSSVTISLGEAAPAVQASVGHVLGPAEVLSFQDHSQTSSETLEVSPPATVGDVQ